MSNNQVGRQPKPAKSTYSEYRVAQAVSRLSDLVNQQGVLLGTISAQLQVLAGMEARLGKKIDDAHLEPSRNP